MLSPLTVTLIGALLPAVPTDPVKEKLPVLKLHELVFRTYPTKEMPAIHKIVRFGVPEGWTGESEPDGHSLRLFAPNGEGKILVAGALHSTGLDQYLDELKKAHPSALPSPPMAMEVRGIRPEFGERATKFVIQGKEMGEMVMIERNDMIILIVTIVDPKAWPRIEKSMTRCYPTVEVIDVKPKP